MGTLNLGIIMNQGDDFNLVIQIAAPGCPPTPIDITGFQFAGQMRPSTASGQGSPVAEFVFTILNQITNKGQVQISLSAATTTALTASIANAEEPSRLTTPYMFDVKMEDLNNITTRILQGNIAVSPQVTMESA